MPDRRPLRQTEKLGGPRRKPALSYAEGAEVTTRP